MLEALTNEDFDFSVFKDPYVEKLKQIIAAKVKGREIETPPQVEEEEPMTVDFTEALRKSLARARKTTPAARSRGSRPSPAKKVS